MIVVDASAMVDALLEPGTSAAIVDRVVGRRGPIAAPELIDVEVMSVLRRWERRGAVDDARAQELLADLLALPLVRHGAREIAVSAWELRHILSAYDAQYVALAQVLDAELLTTDSGMATGAAQAGVGIVDLARG